MGKRKGQMRAPRLSGGEKKHLYQYGEDHPINDSVEVSPAPIATQPRKSLVKAAQRTKKVSQPVASYEAGKSHVKGAKRKKVSQPVASYEADGNSSDDNDDGLENYRKMLALCSRKSKKKQGDLSSATGDQSEPAMKKKKKKLPDAEVDKEELEVKEEKSDRGLGKVDSEEVILRENEDEDVNDSSDDESVQNSGSCRRSFKFHFGSVLPESLAEGLLSKRETSTHSYTSSGLGKVEEITYKEVAACPGEDFRRNLKTTEALPDVSFIGPEVSKEMRVGWLETHTAEGSASGTDLQRSLFKVMNSYRDVMFTDRSSSNAEEIREVICLHAVNHVLKTRHVVLKHNAKLKASQPVDVPDEMRDQGWTRPKVLILLPFRHSAMLVVETILKLLQDPAEKLMVGHRKRFFEEYGEESDDEDTKPGKSADFKEMFAGNVDDNFRIGLSVQRKVVRLFTDFYSSDIILASPLGLRTIIGAEGDRKRDYDFLSSIEIAIVDQADVFLMQNWDHLTHIFSHMNKSPTRLHDADISRVRQWSVNEWGSLYRQNLLFADSVFPLLRSLMIHHSHNFAGQIRCMQAITDGSIRLVTANVEQKFERITTTTVAAEIDERFKYFTDMVLPSLIKNTHGHIGLVVPDYYDYVQVRHHLKKNDVDFVQLSEYTSNANISRFRSYFFHGDAPIALISERYYFYKRHTLRGLHQLVFYQLPHFGDFYAQLTNMLALDADPREERPVRVLYTCLDALRLAKVVGTQHARKILESPKHLFVV